MMQSSTQQSSLKTCYESVSIRIGYYSKDDLEDEIMLVNFQFTKLYIKPSTS